MRLYDLMDRNRFQAINTFLHVVSVDEELQNERDALKKVRPLHDHVKKAALEYYQPLRELSVDERMVKSKGRSQFRQYLPKKPTKWGFKYWVIADATGYTTDFDLYCGSQRRMPISDKGLAHDVVMSLVKPFTFQGYFAFFDNFYTSPDHLNSLKELGIGATGTLRSNRRSIPEDVPKLTQALGGPDVPRGTGYYLRVEDDVYVCWKDKQCVLVMSNNYPGHSDGTVKRRGLNSQGLYETLDIPLPSAIKAYNQFMGGVDFSDQLISYHRVLRTTKKYWKTLFFHLLEVSVTNAAVLKKWLCMQWMSAW